MRTACPSRFSRPGTPFILIGTAMKAPENPNPVKFTGPQGAQLHRSGVATLIRKLFNPFPTRRDSGLQFGLRAFQRRDESLCPDPDVRKPVGNPRNLKLSFKGEIIGLYADNAVCGCENSGKCCRKYPGHRRFSGKIAHIFYKYKKGSKAGRRINIDDTVILCQ